MIRIAIIIGSTRPNRNGEAVGNWVYEQARKRMDAQFDLIDLLDWKLPLLDEPLPPSKGKYTHQHTKDWSAKISQYDAFIFVVPEYNHGINAALKNAIDYLFKEWNNKAAGFVSYGSEGGVRSVEQLRVVMGALMIADVRSQVILSLHEDFEDSFHFKPRERHLKSLEKLFDQVADWGMAMKVVREHHTVEVKHAVK
jgi:NAD(P)H-dependent FMN reductase